MTVQRCGSGWVRAVLAIPGLVVLLSFTAAAQDMPLTQVLIDGEDWELLSEGHRFTEGPAVDRQGNVFFTDIPNSRIHRIDTDGHVTVFAENTERTNGLMFGPDGLLYGCCGGGRRIVAYAADSTVQTVVDDVDCNDLVVASSGALWFTDPPGGRVWYVSPDRQEKRVVADGIGPNGIILWPGEGTLVVTERSAPHLWTFRVETDGSLRYRERYYLPLQLKSGSDTPGSDGMTVDDRSRLYVATRAGIQMFDPTGRLGGTIARPQNRSVSNVCFGGPEFHYLYATCSDKVYRRRVKPVGVPYILKASRKPSPPAKK